MLTVAQLRQSADKACSAARIRQDAVTAPADFGTNSKAAATYLRQLMAAGQQEVVALHLNPPLNLRAAYGSFFADVLREELLIVLAANEAASGRHGYVQQYQAARHYQQGTVVPAARQLGLTSCAS